MTDLISIIITTHGERLPYLKKAIASVKAQTYSDWECIVVDDCSTDDTADFMGDECVVDERFKYLRLDTKVFCHGESKNLGIKMSTGDYLAFLDSDNEYTPDHLRALLRGLKDGMEKDPDCCLAYGMRQVYDESTNKTAGLGVSSEFNPTLLMTQNYIDTSDFVVLRSAIADIGGWSEENTRMLDWNLVARLVKAGYRFVRVPLPLTIYHIHSNQLSKTQEVKDWSPIECKVRMSYLNDNYSACKVAIFSLTYDRLDYSKACFESLNKTAGYKFDHFIVDNGSADGTREWLTDEYKPEGNRQRVISVLNDKNEGISIASNIALNKIFDTTLYDVIVKVDNDCMFNTEGWLSKMVELWKSNNMLSFSPYITGLVDNLGGAPRVSYGTVCGELVGVTRHLGGICHFISARAYEGFRWDETSYKHGMQDAEFSQYCLREGYSLMYLESYFAEHYEGTKGQQERYPEYFERRKDEKRTRGREITEKDYIKTQEEESAFSTDKEGKLTPWGERLVGTIDYMDKYLEGSILDVGCGDGTGTKYMLDKGKLAMGMEIASNKIKEAEAKGVEVFNMRIDTEEAGEICSRFNTVFMSHTLEHVEDIDLALKNILKAKEGAVVIVPIEEGGTLNKGHASPIESAEWLTLKIEEAGGEVVYSMERYWGENELILYIQRKDDSNT